MKHTRRNLKKSEKITVIFDGYKIDCCKVALEQSDFFTSLFGNPDATFSETSKGKIVLKHEQLNLDSLAKVLEFMYDTFDEHVDEHGNDITDYAEKKLELSMNLQNFQSIFIVAHFLQVERIVEICCKFIMEKSDVTNIFDVLNLAQTFDLKNVGEFVKLFFGFYFEQIIITKDFLDASADVIVQIFNLEQMKIESEDTVLKALSNWVSYRESKFKKARQSDLITKLLPLIKKDQVSKDTKERFLQKKWVGDSEWDLLTINSSKRFWPKLLMITKVPNEDLDTSGDDSDESTDFLDELWNGANQTPKLFREFSVRDLQTNSWIDCPLKPLSILSPSSKRGTIVGNWDNVFVISLLETSDSDTSKPNVMIKYIHLEKNCWEELQPTFPHQLTTSCEIKGVFGDNTLFLIGKTAIDLNFVGFMINFNEMEPEWRGFPIPLKNGENCRTVVEGNQPGWKVPVREVLLDLLYTPGKLWILAIFDKKIWDSREKRRKIVTGKGLIINTIFLPDNVAEQSHYRRQLPGHCIWKNKIVSVGGENAAKSCYMFGENDDDSLPLAHLNHGRSAPAVVSENGIIYAVGGYGFFWHENEDSVEIYDGNKKEKIWITGRRGFDEGSYSAFVVNKPIRMFVGSNATNDKKANTQTDEAFEDTDDDIEEILEDDLEDLLQNDF